MRHTVLILAAGMGRRLGVPDGLPKWLAPVGSVTPAAMHLEACHRSDVVTDVVVVAGHGQAAVDDVVVGWRDRLDIAVVANPHYEDRNNWYSLLVGLEALPARRNSSVLVVNSDLCAPVEWFVELFESITTIPGGGALAVDFERTLTDEAMKVAVAADGRRLVQVAKVGVDHPAGEYVGVTFLRPGAVNGLAGMLGLFVDDPARADAWYEHGIQAHIDAGASYIGAPVPDGRWVEIDDPADLAAAERIMAAEP